MENEGIHGWGAQRSNGRTEGVDLLHLKRHDDRTSQLFEAGRPILTEHKGHKAAHPAPGLLLCCSWPHDLDARQRSKFTKQAAEVSLGHLWAKVADIEVGRCRVLKT